MSPRFIADLPEKFTMRASVEQRVNFIALGWYLGNGGKFGPAIRWFMDKYWPRFVAELSEADRDELDKYIELVKIEEEFAAPFLPPPLPE